TRGRRSPRRLGARARPGVFEDRPREAARRTRPFRLEHYTILPAASEPEWVAFRRGTVSTYTDSRARRLDREGAAGRRSGHFGRAAGLHRTPWPASDRGAWRAV